MDKRETNEQRIAERVRIADERYVAVCVAQSYNWGSPTFEEWAKTLTAKQASPLPPEPLGTR
jgi:hypothetical protein